MQYALHNKIVKKNLKKIIVLLQSHNCRKFIMFVTVLNDTNFTLFFFLFSYLFTINANDYATLYYL